MGQLTLHVLIRREETDSGDVWIAQGLEYDLVAQSRSMPQLKKSFIRSLTSFVLKMEEMGHDPIKGLERLGRAPEEAWKAYRNSSETDDEAVPLGMHPPANCQFALAA